MLGKAVLAKIQGGDAAALAQALEGLSVPAGEAYTAIEAPRGELGMYVVSDGENRPYRVKIRDPSFVNLQAVPDLIEGGLIADIIPAIASIDPVMGGVDR